MAAVTEQLILDRILGKGRLYLGSMNDGLFIIDAPPSSAGTDVGPHVRQGQPNCITATWPVSEVRVRAIVDQHNTRLESMQRASQAEAEDLVQRVAPTILEAADIPPNPRGFAHALTCRWADGTETIEHVSENAARLLGYDPDLAGEPG